MVVGFFEEMKGGEQVSGDERRGIKKNREKKIQIERSRKNLENSVSRKDFIRDDAENVHMYGLRDCHAEGQ